MTMFTRRCSRQIRIWRSEFASGFKIFLSLILLSSFFISNRADAQCNSFGIDFKQAANKDAFKVNGVDYVTGEIHWIGSILQNSNSRYVEGMSTLQRLVFNNLPTACNGSCVHTLRVKLETSKNGNHAYDFITSWDEAFAASESIAPGFGLMPSSRSDPKLHECGPDIGACSEVACNLVTTSGGDFEDIPITNLETNLIIPGDQNTTQDVIQTYECRYGDRTVRIYVRDGTFCGTPGDANNQVVFVGYGDANPNDGGTTYIYYDITWCSCSPDVVIEFGAHIAVGVDGLAATNPGGCNETSLGAGYFVGQGASDINGGPYHVIVEDFIGADGTSGTACEPNLGNLDNQLQGSQVLLIPTCNETGPLTACTGQTGLVYSSTNVNEKDATYLWSIINSTSAGTTITSGNETTAGPITVTAGSAGSFTVRFIIKNGGTTQTTDDDISDTCYVTTVVSGGPIIACPSSTTVAACQTQTQIDAAYSAWLASVTSTGGSGGVTNNGGSAPAACGGSKTVTFSVSNTCGTATCSASFTVSSPPAVSLVCPQSTTVASCQTQTAVNAEFTAWLATASSSGGCNGARSNNNTGAPPACGGSTTVTFTYTSSCTPGTYTIKASK
jgi:hypothetical protein